MVLSPLYQVDLTLIWIVIHVIKGHMVVVGFHKNKTQQPANVCIGTKRISGVV